MPYLLRTGIPAIDELFHVREPETHGKKRGITDTGQRPGRNFGDLPWQAGVRLPDRLTTTSFCIVGPDGAGKSVLAMHLASRYLADCVAALGDGPLPLVYYISTDLTHPVARTVWMNFCLHAPNARRVPYRHPPFADERVPKWLADVPNPPTFDAELIVPLVPHRADDPSQLAAEMAHLDDGLPGRDRHVAFVDLASRTAGDDWAFVHRLLAVLPPRPSGPQHLIVIDAIEGLETFGGDLDGFGERSPRRAKVAKLMRLASGKCHVVLIVEEPAEGTRLPEQFVADVVIRMRSAENHGYSRRTIEIEKARGQPIVRGKHPYVIRSGIGSTTGSQPNADDPEIRYPDKPKQASLEHQPDIEPPRFQSYVDLFPSIHQLARSIMQDRGKGRQPPSPHCAGFGIHNLDEMLADSRDSSRTRSDRRGLPCSTVTALIGDAGTQKTGLSLAFLGQAFARFIERVARDEPTKKSDLKRLIRRNRKWAGVAVLLTTHDESQALLTEYFVQHLRQRHDPATDRLFKRGDFAAELRKFIQRRTVCRRLEIHDTPPAVLFHTIRQTVEAAQRILMGRSVKPFSKHPLPRVTEERFRRSWPVRLVIDDFSTIMDTYAQVRTDPLFLPFLLFYLRREGVTSLIEDTRAGGPYAPMEGFHTDLRALSDHRIYTWHVTDFFGDHRVAIAPIPPIADRRGVVVRELRRELVHEARREPRQSPKLPTKGNLVVDTRFELYAGLENNAPRPVPLRIYLYGETEACRTYASYLNTVLRDVFTPASPLLAGEPPLIVVTEDVEYDRLRDFSFLHGDNRLDYTLVFQVDEFWTTTATFRSEWDYLVEARVALGDEKRTPDTDFDDPYKSYQGVRRAAKPRKRAYYARVDFFDLPDCDLEHPKVDRVPYALDYGFLVCRAQPWEHAALADPDAVAAVWRWIQRAGKDPMSWQQFLRAARRVAGLESAARSERVPAFDLSMIAPESFSCLVLEIWLSELYNSFETTPADYRPERPEEFAARLSRRPWTKPSQGLLNWLGAGGVRPPREAARNAGLAGYTFELYLAWLLLVESLDLSSFQNEPRSFGFKANRPAHPLAVAARHWYKTASVTPSRESPDPGPLVYCRLPGHFTTRGDWFLAVASGSRSDRLANRAVDILCSERANVRRMRLGVGLPVRRLLGNPDSDTHKVRTALRRQTSGTGRSLTYAETLALGAESAERSKDAFGWLWRSAISDYARHAASWQQWLYRVLRASQQLKVQESEWRNGFDVYEDIERNASAPELPSSVTSLRSFQEFPQVCEELVVELQRVGR